MPYIKNNERPEIDEDVINLMAHINTPGQLNYAITQLAWLYLNIKGLRYTNMNEVIGVLECVKQEFYRKPLASYEDQKCQEEGEVYNKM